MTERQKLIVRKRNLQAARNCVRKLEGVEALGVFELAEKPALQQFYLCLFQWTACQPPALSRLRRAGPGMADGTSGAFRGMRILLGDSFRLGFHPHSGPPSRPPIPLGGTGYSAHYRGPPADSGRGIRFQRRRAFPD